MTWAYPFADGIDLHVRQRIADVDARRQQATAAAILRRLTDQPGVVLADEVGMGKTFVALAVAASVTAADAKHRPVVVMAPPILCPKWRKDADLFAKQCLGLRRPFRCAEVASASAFLKRLDDPEDRRLDLIILPHGCMQPDRRLQDGWIKLAILQRAIQGRHGADAMRERLARWAPDLLRQKWVRSTTIWSRLLQVEPGDWLAVMRGEGVDPEGDGDASTDDDPVPRNVVSALDRLQLDDVFEALAQMPLRASANQDERLAVARHAITAAVNDLWSGILKQLRVRLPLLIMDEAHHLKNARTRLAGLFANDEARSEVDEMTRGALAGVFERMLFLTATPFQLGHDELCNILDRFGGVAWNGATAPSTGRAGFTAQVDELRVRLDHAQLEAVGLEKSWGRLRSTDLTIEGTGFNDSEGWWAQAVVADAALLSDTAKQVRERFTRCDAAMRAAETRLKPWVVRHLKPRHLSSHVTVVRRIRQVGSAISGSTSGGGITVAGDALLPFLLATRAVACTPSTRSVFAEGLVSSFEAFTDTRKRTLSEVLDVDEAAGESTANVDDHVLRWYLDRLERHLPDSGRHPKVAATAQCVADLWAQGEKTLVFCHYLATGRALQSAISATIQATIERLGAKALGCAPADVASELERIGKRFFAVDSPLRRRCDRAIHDRLAAYPALAIHADQLVDVVRRYLRTPSFLVRSCPLTAAGLEADELVAALERPDGSGTSMSQLIDRFLCFLAERCTDDERPFYLDALGSLQVGSREDAGDDAGSVGRRLLPNVRLANGEVNTATRHRLMATFNTPFFPEVLVASAVMAEGVDLHLNCRHIIHHDLSWNPSTIEQRTGRVDRVGARAELCGQSIQVYLPYIGHTQDEKMFRVVTDRERWFQVVMGEDMQFAEHQVEERVPVPQALTSSLGFRLEAASAVLTQPSM